MSDFNFSEAFLEVAYKALLLNECKIDEERRVFDVLCAVCAEYGIPVKSYMEASMAIEARLKNRD